MTIPAGRVAAGALVVVAGLLSSGCDLAPPPSPSPEPTEEAFVPVPPPAAADVVACVDIVPAECTFVAARVLARLPGIDGPPFSIRVHLGPCRGVEDDCQRSLAGRTGTALVEYPDGGEPRLFSLDGPPGAPVIEPLPTEGWSGPIHPGSPPAESDGPWVFEVGHCGLLHVVDFDSSFWVLVGQVEGDHQALGSSETGSIALTGLQRAQYLGTDQQAFELARFPGAKRVQLCR